MDYLNTSWSAGTELVVGKSHITNGNYITDWTTFAIPLSADVADAANHHSSPTVLGHGPRYCHGVLDYQLIGGEYGEEIQIRTYETDADGNRLETHRPHEFYLSDSVIPVDANGNPLYTKSTHQRFPIVDYINSGHYLKCEITAWGDPDKPVTIRYIQFVANYLT